jgi:hypothetical protein
MSKYVWINLQTGEFSNSWDEETQLKWGVGPTDAGALNARKERHIVLIKYECLNDPSFEFYRQMKLK